MRPHWRGGGWPHSCLPSWLPLSHSPCPSSHLALPPDSLTDTPCTLPPFHTHFQGCGLSCSCAVDNGINTCVCLCYVYDCVNNICLHYMGTRVLRENILIPKTVPEIGSFQACVQSQVAREHPPPICYPAPMFPDSCGVTPWILVEKPCGP